MQQGTYPVQFSVDYPDRPLDRLTTCFRVFVAIPIAIGEVVPGHPPLHRAVLPGHRGGRGGDHRLGRHSVYRALSEGMFAFVEGVIRWHNRVIAYAFVLVTDQYPPFRLGP